MASLFYKVMVVTTGIERIRINRHGKSLFEGALPAGATFHLTVGDSVLVWHSNRWVKKFGLIIWYGKVAMRFGKGAGKFRHQIYMDSTPHVPGKTRSGKVLHRKRKRILPVRLSTTDRLVKRDT